MELTMLTRGQLPDEDYRWLSQYEINQWWAPFRAQGFVRTEYTEYPCLLLHLTDNFWNLLIGSVPSCRRDHMNRDIGFHLQLTGADEAADVRGALAFINLWLADLGSAYAENDKLFVGRGLLSSLLDRTFPTEVIQSWFHAQTLIAEAEQKTSAAEKEQTLQAANSIYREIERRSQELIADVTVAAPLPADESQPDAQAAMLGCITSANDRNRFLSRVQAAFKNKETGLAAYTNPLKPKLPDVDHEGFHFFAVLSNPSDIRIMRTNSDLITNSPAPQADAVEADHTTAPDAAHQAESTHEPSHKEESIPKHEQHQQQDDQPALWVKLIDFSLKLLTAAISLLTLPFGRKKNNKPDSE